MQRIQIDTTYIDEKNLPFWNDGTKYLLTVIDVFSKYAWAYPMKNFKSNTVATIMKKHFKEHGIPSTLQTDNGVEFKNAFKSLLNKIPNLKHIRSAPYRSHSQGAVEVFNKTIKRAIFHWMDIYKTKTYIDIIPKILENYNNSKHTTTGVSPNELHNTEDNELVELAAKRIKTKGESYITTRNQEPLNKGNYVKYALQTLPEIRRKSKLSKKGYHKKWSDTVHLITFVSKKKENKEEQYTLIRRKQIYVREELQFVDIDKLNVIHDKRPKRYDGKERRRSTGELLVPRRIPEYTQAQERKNRGNLRKSLPGDIQKKIGKRIQVYWKKYKKYYNGKIVGYNIARAEYEFNTTNNFFYQMGQRITSQN